MASGERGVFVVAGGSRGIGAAISVAAAEAGLCGAADLRQQRRGGAGGRRPDRGGGRRREGRARRHRGARRRGGAVRRGRRAWAASRRSPTAAASPARPRRWSTRSRPSRARDRGQPDRRDALRARGDRADVDRARRRGRGDRVPLLARLGLRLARRARVVRGLEGRDRQPDARASRARSARRASASTRSRPGRSRPKCSTPAKQERAAGLSPIGRIGTPEEIAAAVMFMVSRRRPRSSPAPTSRSRAGALTVPSQTKGSSDHDAQRRAGERDLSGTWVKIPSLETVELLGHAGFDFVVVDMEHAPHALDTAYTMIFAAQAMGMRAYVRLADRQGSDIQRLLDARRRRAARAASRRPRDRRAADPADGVRARGRARPRRDLARGALGAAAGARTTSRAATPACAWSSSRRGTCCSDAARYLALEHVGGVFVGLGDLFLSSGRRPDEPETRAMVAAVARAGARGGQALGHRRRRRGRGARLSRARLFATSWSATTRPFSARAAAALVGEVRGAAAG